MTSETPHWYVIHTHPRQEERADRNLSAWGVETFFPKIRGRRRNQFTNKPILTSEPLFPRYIFARFEAGALLSKVCYTRGVQGVIRQGDSPAPVDNEIVDAIWAQVGEHGFVRMNDELKRGDRVVVKEGLFRDFVGIFERDTKAGDRIIILLTAINYQNRVVLERDQVKKLS